MPFWSEFTFISLAFLWILSSFHYGFQWRPFLLTSACISGCFCTIDMKLVGILLLQQCIRPAKFPHALQLSPLTNSPPLLLFSCYTQVPLENSGSETVQSNGVLAPPTLVCPEPDPTNLPSCLSLVLGLAWAGSFLPLSLSAALVDHSMEENGDKTTRSGLCLLLALAPHTVGLPAFLSVPMSTTHNSTLVSNSHLVGQCKNRMLV